MMRFGFLITTFLILTAGVARNFDAPIVPVISSPRPGDVVQGVVPIKGSSNVENFQSAEIDFAYEGDTTATWFLINESRQPVEAAPLATWDTSTITDGNYEIRLHIVLMDGTSLDAFVQNLRVRNYTPVETPTPAPTTVQPTSTPTATLTLMPFPTPTPLPSNPAVLTFKDISTSLTVGGLGAVLFLAIIGIYLGLRRR